MRSNLGTALVELFAVARAVSCLHHSSRHIAVVDAVVSLLCMYTDRTICSTSSQPARPARPGRTSSSSHATLILYVQYNTIVEYEAAILVKFPLNLVPHMVPFLVQGVAVYYVPQPRTCCTLLYAITLSYWRTNSLSRRVNV